MYTTAMALYIRLAGRMYPLKLLPHPLALLSAGGRQFLLVLFQAAHDCAATTLRAATEFLYVFGAGMATPHPRPLGTSVGRNDNTGRYRTGKYQGNIENLHGSISFGYRRVRPTHPA